MKGLRWGGDEMGVDRERLEQQNCCDFYVKLKLIERKLHRSDFFFSSPSYHENVKNDESFIGVIWFEHFVKLRYVIYRTQTQNFRLLLDEKKN